MGRWQCYGLGPLLPREVECLVHSRPTGQDPWERNYSSTKKSTSLVGWSISMEKPRSWRRFAGDGQTTLSLRWAVGTLPKKNGKYHRAEGAEPAKTAEAWSGEAAAAIAAQPTSWQRGGWLGWIFFSHARSFAIWGGQHGYLEIWAPNAKKCIRQVAKTKNTKHEKYPEIWTPNTNNVLPKAKLKNIRKLKQISWNLDPNTNVFPKTQNTKREKYLEIWTPNTNNVLPKTKRNKIRKLKQISWNLGPQCKNCIAQFQKRQTKHTQYKKILPNTYQKNKKKNKNKHEKLEKKGNKHQKI